MDWLGIERMSFRPRGRLSANPNCGMFLRSFEGTAQPVVSTFQLFGTVDIPIIRNCGSSNWTKLTHGGEATPPFDIREPSIIRNFVNILFLLKNPHKHIFADGPPPPPFPFSSLRFCPSRNPLWSSASQWEGLVIVIPHHCCWPIQRGKHCEPVGQIL